VTAHLVLVTRDSHGFNKRMAWCETEQRYYLDGVAVELTFDDDHNVWWGKTLRESPRAIGEQAALTLTVLTCNPWADVSDLFTHDLPEPGAPLDPIAAPGRAA
jgi:hypothetical protein